MKYVRTFFLPLILLTACAKVPYTYRGEQYPAEDSVPPNPQISRGEELPIVDGIGHYLFSLPEKLILWNWNMGRHKISPETEAAIREYLEANKLTKVKIRLNEYDPGDDWNRLTKNTEVAAGYRYTIGALLWLYNTVLPGRIFGGDNFNPYTNTVSIYSDVPVVGLHEVGHAKDYAGTKYKGSRSLLRLLPLVPLYDEAEASGDAFGYANDNSLPACQKKGYKVLYPAYGTYIGGELLNFVPGSGLITAAAAIPGHIIGRIKASNIEADDSNLDICLKPKENDTSASTAN